MKHIIPELELEQAQNISDLKISESFQTIIQEKIAYRRKRVNQLRLRGYTNQQIADKIGCNLSTVEKDLQDIRQNARKWFEEDTITEYCQSINDGIILCDNVIEDLQILYIDEVDTGKKLQILSLISTYEIKKTELYEKTKSVQNYLRRDK